MKRRAWSIGARFGLDSVKLTSVDYLRFVRGRDTTLEQQLLDVAQTQAEPEVPTEPRS